MILKIVCHRRIHTLSYRYQVQLTHGVHCRPTTSHIDIMCDHIGRDDFVTGRDQFSLTKIIYSLLDTTVDITFSAAEITFSLTEINFR